jgi:hypothetical protein
MITTLAQVMQVFLVSGNQCLFLRTTPAFELLFALDCLQFRREGLMVEDGRRSVRGRMCGACPFRVTIKSGRKVVCVSHIGGPVVTGKDVDVPFHGEALRRSHYVPLLRAFDAFADTLLWPAMSK